MRPCDVQLFIGSSEASLQAGPCLPTLHALRHAPAHALFTKACCLLKDHNHVNESSLLHLASRTPQPSRSCSRQ